MTLRQKLLLFFSLVVIATVAALSATVVFSIRQIFGGLDRRQTEALTSQFQRAFDLRGKEIAADLDDLAANQELRRVAAEFGETGNAGPYVTVAAPLAQVYRLSYLEIVAFNGRIISSAQWPARFGYREPAIAAAEKPPFLREEDLPDGTSQIGLFVTRTVTGSDRPLYLVGGTQLDSDFLQRIPAPPGAQILLYRNLTPGFDSRNFAGTGEPAQGLDRYRALVSRALATGRNARALVDLSAHREDSVSATAIPLKGAGDRVFAVVLLADSLRSMVQLQNRIAYVGWIVAGLGLLFAVAASFWIAARISRPLDQLARAADRVAAGDWDARIEIVAAGEAGALARNFHHMTGSLVAQRDRLVQSERVAAWRSLGRRFAQELRTSLAPLQSTVDNLLRADSLPRAQFEQVFASSAAALQAEVATLRTIVGRLSEFSSSQPPQLEPIDARNPLRRVVSLYEPILAQKKIELATRIALEPLPILADPELLHRALSNLLLNAIEAMPQGGRFAVSATRANPSVRISLSDTRAALSPEERASLFAPWDPARQQGSGLSLAIVQCIIVDHRGAIAVENAEGGGARFVIELPLATPASSPPRQSSRK